MEITRGKIPSAQKVVIYGPEGIGKSTFASKFPDPVFIDTEGSTKHMDVARLPKPSSWTMLLEEIRHIRDSAPCATIVIDTADWAEQLCVESICAAHNKKGIEDFGYGNGYVYVKEEFGRFLNLLSEVADKGINVVLTAHAQLRKFEQPDELGAYDRYELKLGKKTSSQTSPLVKEWADAVLFANYKTFSVAADDKGKKFKAQGGARVMYTAHHPCWDAKNRWGLKDELPFDYGEIAAFIPSKTIGKQETKPIEPIQNDIPDIPDVPDIQPEIPKASGLPKALTDLMEQNFVTEDEIRSVVAQKGYYPFDMAVEDYDKAFIDGVLVAAWPQVLAMIEENRKDEIPF